MYVVFLHGPAASGKHTVGMQLSDRMQLPLFHNHLTVDLVKTLFDFGTESFCALRATIWRESFREAAAANRPFIFTFHPEASVDPGLISELVQIVESVAGDVFFVELRCPDETVLDRLGNTSRAKFGKLVDADLYREISSAGGFDFPPLPTPLVVIETDAVAPEVAADKIMAALPDF